MIANVSSGSLLAQSVTQASWQVPARVIGVGLAVGLTAAAAQFTLPLPFTAVPITLTPFAVMLSAAALGSRLGFLTQLIYLGLGAAGLAVFTPSATLPPGAARLVGPTGGYLLAYPAAAFLTGWLAERGWDRRYLTSLASMLAGLLVIFVGGVSWLSLLPGQTIGSALAAGFLPFIWIDLLKAAIAAKALPVAWQLLGKR